MSDIKGLKASVLAQSHEKGRLNLAAAREKIQADFETEKEQLMLEKERENRDRLSDVTRQRQLDLQRLENEARQSHLAIKQKLLNELYEAALEEMVNWSEEKHIAFFKRIVARYDRIVTVQFGQKTAETFSEATWQTLYQAFTNVTFEEEVILGEAGFLISEGRVEANYLYSTLLQDFWELESYSLVAQIFQAEIGSA